MRELPILFSAPMVRAILEGRKSVTLHVVNRLASFGKISEFGKSDTPGYDWHFRNKAGLWNDISEARLTECGPWKVGDRLYVRERFKPIASGQVKRGYGHIRYGYAYEADGATRWNDQPTIIHDLTGSPEKGPKQFQPQPWRAAICMPHRASRVFLEVTAVRVERLKDICEQSAWDQGIQDFMGGPTPWKDVLAPSSVHGFAGAWEGINGPGSWLANPWVWVVEFRRIEA